MRIEADVMDYQEPIRRNSVRTGSVLLYRTKTIKSGDILEAEIYPVISCDKKERGEKKKKTSEQIARYNKKEQEKRLERLINCNFTRGDIFLTLTHADWCDQDQAQRDVKNYVRRLKRIAGKQGVELKYIYTIEQTHGEAGERWHSHMIINQMDLAAVTKTWSHGLVTSSYVVLNADGGLRSIAKYMIKQKKTQDHGSMVRMWAGSQNLKRPQVTISDTKFTRGRAANIEKAIREQQAEYIEKKYHGYRMTRDVVLGYSDVLPGVYIYAFLRKK